MIFSIFPNERNRWLTHLGLALITLIWSYASSLILPDTYKSVRVLAIATGYIALLFLIVTLLIGPLQLIRQGKKRNPVNINLRRDIGIWAGLTGILHVIFGFQVHLQGRIILYFFSETDAGYQPLLNLFGTSNFLGVGATIILLGLLILSNDISLRWLKGKRWKNLQRFNYGLLILVVAHTIGYQLVVNRDPVMRTMTIIFTVVLLIIQLVGFFLFRQRRS